jgi:hypothetical protein
MGIHNCLETLDRCRVAAPVGDTKARLAEDAIADAIVQGGSKRCDRFFCFSVVELMQLRAGYVDNLWLRGRKN